ncbi:MAG: glycyl-radical enzyme activating protein [Bacteroidales bacterium]
MTGLIFDIKHYAVHDGPGIRQTIFFKGCPLSCWWCHNPESQFPEIEYYTKKKTLDGKVFRKKESIGYKIDSKELFKIIEGDTLFYDESNGGVTFSGGEPLMQLDFLQEIVSMCKEAGIHTALDTSGYAPQEDFLKILSNIDLILFDLKIIDEELHQKYTGVSNRELLENLKMLDESGKKIRIRFPVIPGITDTQQNIEEIKSFLSRLKKAKDIDILPYHDISKGKYNRFNKKNKMGNVSLDSDIEKKLKNEFESIHYTVKIGG